MSRASHDECVSVPFVLLADVISLAQVDEVGNGLGRQQLQAVDDINLGREDVSMDAKIISVQ